MSLRFCTILFIVLGRIALGGDLPSVGQLVAPAERFSVPEAIQETGMKALSSSAPSFQGNHSILVFGFTTCMGTCPTTMKLLEKILSDSGFNLTPQVFFATVAPKADDPVRLKSFLSRYRIKATALFGSNKATADFYAKFVKGRASVLFSPVQHTSLIYIIGPDGRLKAIVSTEAPVGQVRRALSSVIEDQ